MLATEFFVHDDGEEVWQVSGYVVVGNGAYSAAMLSAAPCSVAMRAMIRRAAMAPASWMVSITGQSSRLACCNSNTSQSWQKAVRI